jgi:hypothetical protein
LKRARICQGFLNATFVVAYVTIINMQKSYRTTEIVTAIFFLLTDITAIVGLLLYQPLLTNPNFITSVNVNNTQILVGVFLELMLSVCIVGTAVALYPILKKINQSLAMGYVVFRTMEATIILIGVMCILSVLSMHSNFLAFGGDASVYEAIGATLVALQKWTFTFGPNIILPINATILGYLLYKSKLVPRIISSLYLFDGPILLASSMFILFGFYAQTAPLAIAIAMPALAFEISFSVWLIIKGFNRSALATLETKGN